MEFAWESSGVRLRLRILTTVALVLVSVAATSPSATAATGIACNGSAKLCDLRLDQVVLPGSHNAMSSKELGWGAPNQNLSMLHQMERGIRALLIDTHWGIPGSYKLFGHTVNYTRTADSSSDPARRPYFCHSSCELGATPLAPGLHWIASFLSHNPNEVMVVIVEDYVGADAISAAAADGGLAPYIYTGSTSTWPTLRQMVTSGKRLVMLTESGTSSVSWYHPAYTGLLQETPYSFATPGLLTSASGLATSCRVNRGGSAGKLFLMNHFVTPSGLGVPKTADAQAVNTKAAIVARARACRTARGRLPTILAVNHTDLGDVVGAARQLNGL